MNEHDEHRGAYGPLSAEVARACARLRSRVDGDVANGVARVTSQLVTPLRVAVVGTVNGGKSTLVNALLGRTVATTGIGACTKFVTRYRHGPVDRIDVVRVDGSSAELPFDEHGMVPAEPGGDPATVSHLDVRLSAAALESLTVIDTPGLSSAATSRVAHTERLADPGGACGIDAAGTARVIAGVDTAVTSAAAAVDAVIYVFTDTARLDDVQTLVTHPAGTAAHDTGPIAAIGVLNKADTVALDPRDPDVDGHGRRWHAVESMTSRWERALAPRVARVLPLAGRLAQTAQSGRLTAADASALTVLARYDGATVRSMLLDPDLFIEWECGLSPQTRRRLLERLDGYGIAVALEFIRDRRSQSVGELRVRLSAASGISALQASVDELFLARSDEIKAAAALRSLAALAAAAGARGRYETRRQVSGVIETVLATPPAHRLRLLEVATLVATGVVELPAAHREEILALARPADPSLSPRMALERARWWRAAGVFEADPVRSDVAHVVHRTYFLHWQRLRQDGMLAG